MTQEKLKDKRIGVLYGGRSAEREVSLQTGEAVERALRERGYATTLIDVDQEICTRLLQAHVDVAFIALHGRYGEDGCIQGLLESMGIPYTSSGVLASALAMDKVQTKRLLETAGLPTAEWRYPATPAAVRELGLPCVIKPRREGSSVGLSVVREASAIATAIERAGGPEQALVERYVKGREIAVAVLGAGAAARALGTVEIRPADGLYDYAAKYTRNDTQYVVPAPVPAPIEQRLGELALAVHRLLDCSGATRSDFIWDEGEVLVTLELNSIPGMTSHSLLPKIAQHAGLSYGDLVEAIVRDAALKA